MQRILNALDGFSEWSGRLVAWLTLAMVLVTFGTMTMRLTLATWTGTMPTRMQVIGMASKRSPLTVMNTCLEMRTAVMHSLRPIVTAGTTQGPQIAHGTMISMTRMRRCTLAVQVTGIMTELYQTTLVIGMVSLATVPHTANMS